MMLTRKHYDDMTLEVKDIVIRAMDYRYICHFDNRYVPSEYIKEDIERKILSEMRGLIEIRKLDSYPDQRDYPGTKYEGRIYLPYVYDKVMKEKEKSIEFYQTRASRNAQEIVMLKTSISNFNKLPWYKRAWQALTKGVNHGV